ncbi:electron transfer flavoprotein subunit alpha/FixB family protein [Fusibacter sp. JL216-2]|uniref:electron transfer flavoprotein subunit alpha/FixB family protein n=1 Tax=Fusibacter sp. JL216-2 TaxID=3071453 RepID=UPI003D352747
MKHTDYKDVMVFCEQREGHIEKVSKELVSKGRELANELDCCVRALVLGHNMKDDLNELIHLGADEVILVDEKELAIYMTEPYTKAMVEVVLDRKPDVILVGASTIGRDLAPRVSARINTGLTADCTKLEVDEETKDLLMTRPAFGGNIMATIICPEHRPQMSTVRPGVMTLAEADTARKGVISKVPVAFDSADMNIEILEVVKETKAKVNIEDANILVSGGRGVGKPENMSTLENLALRLGGTVSASRAVVDAGWIDRNNQVGQTGKTVRPDLYFACGISGAIQHLAGMEDSEFIVAINKDETAPIFDAADLGIVGDVHKVIPELMKLLPITEED